jgi:dienelactone hydrolase
MIRRGARRWSLLAALATLSAPIAGPAQSVRENLDAADQRRRRLLPLLAVANASPCRRREGIAEWREGSVAGTRAGLRRQLRPMDRHRGGEILRRDRRVEVAGVTVDFVQFRSRAGEVAVPGYLLRPPVARRLKRGALLIHGTRTPFEEALGWNFGVAQGLISTGNSPIHGLAVTLAASGFDVLVPFVDDELPAGGLEPWSSLARVGSAIALRGEGGSQSILLGNLLGGLDLLEDQGAGAVGVVGDAEGASLAMLLGSLDNRVVAIASLMPALDRRALRSDLAELLRWPTYTQIECAIDDPTVARALASQSVLFAVAQTDTRMMEYRRRFGGEDVEAEVRREHALGGGTPVAFRAYPTTDVLQRSLAAWLTASLGALPTTATSGNQVPVLRRSSRDAYPIEAIAQYRRAIARATFDDSRTPVLAVAPSLETEPIFLKSVAATRSAVWRELTGGRPSVEAAAIVTERDTIPVAASYVLERVVLRWPATGARLEAMVATPREAPRPLPLVFSTDATLGANELFGLPPLGRTTYLGAYGDVLARAGFMVVAPIIEPEVPNLLTPLMRARDASSPGGWSILLPMYRSVLGAAFTLASVDTGRVIAYGISFGGYAALAIAALDDRVTELVFANPADVHEFLFAAPDLEHAPWLLDGAAVWDVMERYLIFPKRFLRESESTDRYERTAFQRPREVESLYRLLGRGDRFRFIAQPVGHRTYIEHILPWLREGTVTSR